jgi:chloramphenicol 3-O-phosphotransferase
MPHLIVIYGAPYTGKTSVARRVAASLEGMTALVGVDWLLVESIVGHSPDTASELGMVHTQAQLMVANYLKNRYNVVVEGAFSYERNGIAANHEQEIDQLVALMHNLARQPFIVRLLASATSLRRRASGREDEVARAMRISASYKPRNDSRSIEIDTNTGSITEIAAQIVERLAAVDIA